MNGLPVEISRSRCWRTPRRLSPHWRLSSRRLGPISGAHFNPVVTLSALVRRQITPGRAIAYVTAQIIGCCAGAMLANAMFDPAAGADGDPRSLRLRAVVVRVRCDLRFAAGDFAVALSRRRRLARAPVDRRCVLVHCLDIVRKIRRSRLRDLSPTRSPEFGRWMCPGSSPRSSWAQLRRDFSPEGSQDARAAT